MMKSSGKIAGFALASALVAVLLASMCASLGVSPASSTMQFEPGRSYELGFNIVNSESASLSLSLSSFGELADHVFIEQAVVSARPGQYLTPFKVVVRLPQSLPPGIHTAFIKVTPDLGGSSDTFRAFVSPVIQLNVRMPYPDKYAEVSIGVLSVDEGTPVPVNLEFDNLGSADIAKAGGIISVFSPDGTLVEKLTASDISVGANSFGKSEGVPAGPLRRGAYSAVASAHYDGEELEISSNFSIGEPVVRIGEPNAWLSAGEINEVKFTASSDWNGPVTVKGFLIFGGSESEMPLFTLEPGREKTVSGFIEVPEDAPRNAELKVRLLYASTVKEEAFDVRVSRGIVPAGAGGNMVFILSASAFIMALAIILLLLWRRKRRQEPSHPPESGPSVEEKPLNSPPPKDE